MKNSGSTEVSEGIVKDQSFDLLASVAAVIGLSMKDMFDAICKIGVGVPSVHLPAVSIESEVDGRGTTWFRCPKKVDKMTQDRLRSTIADLDFIDTLQYTYVSSKGVALILTLKHYAG